MMLDWLMLHFHGLIDWGLVFLAVFGLVFICQGMINFLKDPEDEE
jgi:hypothetical protein